VVKRYEVCEQNGNEYEDENGRFILYEDYEKLEEKNKLTEMKLVTAEECLYDLGKENEKLKKQNIELKDYIEDTRRYLTGRRSGNISIGGGVGVVKRYDFNGYDVCKDEEIDGDYVSYEDYKKLEEEYKIREDLNRRDNELQFQMLESIKSHQGYITKLKKEIEALQKVVEV